MERQLTAQGLNFRRFEAIRGLAVPPGLKDRFLDTHNRPLSNLKPGEIGVYASHLAILQELLRSDDECVIVMEDDLHISERLPAFLTRLNDLPGDWDIVRLSNPSKSAYVAKADLGVAGELVAYLRVPNNMGCYLVNKRGAAKILAGLEVAIHAIDEDLRRPWDFSLITYGMSPPPVDANVLATSSIDAIGERNLARETGMQKLLRRRRIGPAGLRRKMAWQVQTLGIGAWLECLARSALFRAARSLGVKRPLLLRADRTRNDES
jgi:glycosyl transferase family 25